MTLRIKIDSGDKNMEYIYAGLLLPPLKDIIKTISEEIKEYYERNNKRGN